MGDELLTAEQAQRRLGISRTLFWTLVKRLEVPQLTQPTQTNTRGHRSAFRPEDVERLRGPARRVLAAARVGMDGRA
jgi:predicted DNA-binding transcriptional regulator AlpA